VEGLQKVKPGIVVVPKTAPVGSVSTGRN